MDNTSVYILHRLLNQIWMPEQTSDDLRKGLLVKLPKKRTHHSANIVEVSALLSIPSKVWCSIIMYEKREEVDKKLRDEQAGFKQERSCFGQMATPHIIIRRRGDYWMAILTSCKLHSLREKLRQHWPPSPVENIRSLWSPTVGIIKQFYEGFACHVIHAETVKSPLQCDNRRETGLFVLSTLVTDGSELSQ